MPHKILIVEDNPDISALVSLHLEDMGCVSDRITDGEVALRQARGEHYDLIIVDLMLPGLDGLELCRRLRAAADSTPILMLTARTSEIDRVVGLEIGADDYLTKPFSIRELLARVKAIFRRAEEFRAKPEGKPVRLVAGDMVVAADKRSVTVGDMPVDLTAKEFDLLLQFAEHPGRVYSREQLLDLVWGYGHAGYEHTVNSHINRLRGKIERDPANPRYVLTVWGVGYKFNDQLGS